MRRSARIAQGSHTHAENTEPSRPAGRRCRPHAQHRCRQKQQQRRQRPYDKWERAFRHCYYPGIVTPLIVAAAESIRGRFGRAGGTAADDLAALWLAMKLLSLPQLTPRLSEMVCATGVDSELLVEAELRLCRAADWNFAAIMFEGQL